MKIKETLRILSSSIKTHQYLYALIIPANIVSGIAYFIDSQWSPGPTCLALAFFIALLWVSENLIEHLNRVNKSLLDLNDDLISLNKEILLLLDEKESRAIIQNFNTFNYGLGEI